MTKVQRYAAIAAVGLLGIGILLAQVSGTGGEGKRGLGDGPSDSGPSGLLALTALLADSDHDVERVGDTPSSGDLDPDKTTFLVAPGTITAADANALNDLADDGGRVVVAGDPGTDSLSLLLGSDAEITSGSPGTYAPLTPAPETAGVASIEGLDGDGIESTGSALPIAGGSGANVAIASNVGSGRMIVLADPSVLRNEGIGSADNARFALNLAGPDGRDVQIVEAVRTPPGDGLAALPASWGWVAAGLLLAALALAWGRGRRLGPPELDARPLAPPRMEFVDAMATALTKTHEPSVASAPLREAARERLARRAGLPHDATDGAIRDAAEAAGLEPDEVDAVSGTGSGTDMLAAAGALAKLSKRT